MFPLRSDYVQTRVRFLAYHRIKPHVPPLVRAPVNSFEFHRCRRTPQVGDISDELAEAIIKEFKVVELLDVE